MRVVRGYKTRDGKIFETLEEAERHEESELNYKINKGTEATIRETLTGGMFWLGDYFDFNTDEEKEELRDTLVRFLTDEREMLEDMYKTIDAKTEAYKNYYKNEYK
jgi:hypothetical protein